LAGRLDLPLILSQTCSPASKPFSLSFRAGPQVFNNRLGGASS